VGVPASSFVLGKHSGRHALSQRCEQLGFHLDRRELDHVYRRFIALADDSKTVGDRWILEIIGAMRRGDSSADVADSHELPIPATALENAFGVTGTKMTFPHDSEQQEDYLWGV
jgi:hypothetical protein